MAPAFPPAALRATGDRATCQRLDGETHGVTRNRLLRSPLPCPNLPAPPPGAGPTSSAPFSRYFKLCVFHKEWAVVPCFLKNCAHINVHAELKYITYGAKHIIHSSNYIKSSSKEMAPGSKQHIQDARGKPRGTAGRRGVWGTWKGKDKMDKTRG